MWDLPRPGLKLMSPALAGGFLTTASLGKSPFFLISNFLALFPTIFSTCPQTQPTCLELLLELAGTFCSAFPSAYNVHQEHVENWSFAKCHVFLKTVPHISCRDKDFPLLSSHSILHMPETESMFHLPENPFQHSTPGTY